MDSRNPNFGLWDFPAAFGKALHSETWLEHCILTGSGVRCQSAGKSKWKSQSISFLTVRNVATSSLAVHRGQLRRLSQDWQGLWRTREHLHSGSPDYVQGRDR